MDYNGMVKGALLLARMRYVRSLGSSVTQAIVSSLQAGDLEILEGSALKPESWHPADLLARLDAAIALGTGIWDREALLVAIGRFSAEACFGRTGALRTYAGRNDPHALLREVPRVHPALQGAGEHGYARMGANAAVVRAVKGHRNEGGDCLTNVGWLRRAIELCGGRDVRVLETACIGRGGNCCEFRCEWR